MDPDRASQTLDERRDARALETDCAKAETAPYFVYFSARNPLKSPDSEK